MASTGPGVVYEVPVEATMNRYLAIMEDYDDLKPNRFGAQLPNLLCVFCAGSLMPSMRITDRVPLQSHI